MVSASAAAPMVWRSPPALKARPSPSMTSTRMASFASTIQAEPFEFLGDRKVDRVERRGTVERDGCNRAINPQQCRIVGKGGGGMIGCRHLKAPVRRTVAWYLNSRSQGVTIPGEVCKMQIHLPHFA